mgnify:CR=1 FL=1
MTLSLGTLIQVFGRIGLLSFGGPAAQIALMHDILVTKEKWLTEDQFLRALSLCMLLPGPEAMQLCTYAGWRLRGVTGGIIAGGLFVLPGALVIFGLAFLYLHFGNLPAVQAAFLGIKAAVIVVVIQALLRLGRKALSGPSAWALAGLAFVSLFVFGVPFPVIIIASALFGALTYRDQATSVPETIQMSWPLRTIAVWGGLWTLPFVILLALEQDFLLQIATFFSKLAVVTFGGAYAVLAYMTQQVVQDFGWITTGEMIDALGLAGASPGPLLLVTLFVAILAGHGQGAVPGALLAGGIALWVTFVPCFLWIFVAGPFLDQLAARPRLSSSLEAITAAVVGVILNLSVWFALHVLFFEVGSHGTLSLPIPDVFSVDAAALLLTIGAAVLLLGFKLVLPLTLAVMAASGLALQMVGLS